MVGHSSRLVELSSYNAEITGSSLLSRDGYCVGTLSKFFTHDCFTQIQFNSIQFIFPVTDNIFTIMAVIIQRRSGYQVEDPEGMDYPAK